jgi:hypothetical protein
MPRSIQTALVFALMNSANAFGSSLENLLGREDSTNNRHNLRGSSVNITNIKLSSGLDLSYKNAGTNGIDTFVWTGSNGEGNVYCMNGNGQSGTCYDLTPGASQGIYLGEDGDWMANTYMVCSGVNQIGYNDDANGYPYCLDAYMGTLTITVQYYQGLTMVSCTDTTCSVTQGNTAAVYSPIPTQSPTVFPTFRPSANPTTGYPSSHPTANPSSPSSRPSSGPTSDPSAQPSAMPSQPSSRPSRVPTKSPVPPPPLLTDTAIAGIVVSGVVVLVVAALAVLYKRDPERFVEVMGNAMHGCSKLGIAMFACCKSGSELSANLMNNVVGGNDLDLTDSQKWRA